MKPHKDVVIGVGVDVPTATLRLSDYAVNELCSLLVPPRNFVSASQIRLIHVSVLCFINADTACSE